MKQRTEVQKVIDEKSTKFGKQVSNLVDIAQPDPKQEIQCPACAYEFLLSEADIEPMDLDKIETEIATTLRTHIQHIVDMTIIEKSNGTELNNLQLIASLEKQRDAFDHTAQNLASQIDNINPMIGALTFIFNEISKTKQRTAVSVENRLPMEEIALAQGKTLDLILAKIQAVAPKS
ncbi:hypothetical protein LCGC14_0444200 [marine sediment metagenome]|uniref:Uncharacterized protein n=1 Tax=marine sediment metagenome TaxID=412755 RepID=A0A0F9V6G0_9ZZZZ